MPRDEIAALFRRVTTGVYVVCVSDGDRQNAFTAAWIAQTSFNPLLVSLSISPEHASYPLLLRGRVFSVNVLRREQMDLARHFGTSSGRALDKLADIPWRRGRTGAPILADALAYLDCRLARRLRTGDHELVIGQVVDGALVAPDATPMTYAETGELDGSRSLYPDSM